MSLPNYLKQALETGFWDNSVESNAAFRPQFVANEKDNTMFAFLDKSLHECEKFVISVAFINDAGLSLLKTTLEYLEDHNIPGKILTTDYLTFTEPKALKILMGFKNIELKMYCCGNSQKGFHTKGYLFFKDDIVKISIGSSNLTRSAILENKEWNTIFTSSGKGEIYQHIIDDFETLWNSEHSHTINEETLEEYQLLYAENKRLEQEKKRILKESKVVSIEQIKLEPNQMQIAFIKRLKQMQENGAKRALLISATGTGKTYAAAFALRDMKPQRALFLVHREIILKQARKSFKKVFGDTKSLGLYTGSTKELDRDFIFATMQTMIKHYTEFAKDSFDVVVVDEAHRAGADGYQEIMEYFTPKFMLGMTASPDRLDGFDVYKTFDYNIAHEIRLQEAMRLNLLCPFNYYGITDLFVNGQKKENREFENLVSDKRVNFVIEKANRYGYCGKRLKGLVFCSSVKEADELSKKFAERGFRTAALHSKMKINGKKISGKELENLKEETIQKLEEDDYDNGLDYIFTFDMFNEGVDIPQVNQVIMLRPTQSPIVFIQQLGRGLRKADGKEYLMVLDFIGNYNNDYLIAVALSGDRSYKKDNMRRFIQNGSKVLDGGCTIHFDEIAKERIFRSIDQITNIPTIIKNSYQTLKLRLGRVPSLIDFWDNGEVDPLLILNKYGNYYEFLRITESELPDQDILNEQESNILTYLSTILAKGMLIKASRLLQILLNKGIVEYGPEIEKNIVSILQGSFLKKTFYLEGNGKKSKIVDEKKTGEYWANNINLIDIDGNKAKAKDSFAQALSKTAFRKYVDDIITLSFAIYDKVYKPYLVNDNPFVLYEKYSRQDVCLLLNADKDLSSTMYGKWRQNDDVCIFVTYHKADAGENKEYLEGKPNYADEFRNDEIFYWDTQMGKDENSSYMKDVETAPRKHLFVKKSDGEGDDFYYMGKFKIIEKKHATKKDNKGKEHPIAKVTFEMETRVKTELLNYLKAN